MGHNQMKEGHGPAPIHMAVILVIILATNMNSHLQSTCCIPVVNILFYHMRHVSRRYFKSAVAEGGYHEVFYSISVKDQISFSWLISCSQSIIL